MAIREYTILKVASLIECAPGLPTPWGFEVLLFSNCAVFAMERCVEISGPLLSKEAQRAMETLHYFSIFHCDIKRDNLMHSPTLNKAVFIDYGLSLLTTRPDHRVFTKFRGTPNYCSDEMLELFTTA